MGYQAFKYGQLILIQRDSSAEDRALKAITATECYKAALAFLSQTEPGPKAARDARILREKCLVQYALALHLSQQHDSALLALEEVEATELRNDIQDLKFGVLLSVRV